MGTLNSPSSRIVKDSTPSRRRILRYINLHLIIFEAWWTLTERAFLLFYYFLCFKANLVLEKTNQLVESSPNFIFAVVNLDPIILEKRWIHGESWPNDFVEKVNRGEDLRWVGSRCPLTHALTFQSSVEPSEVESWEEFSNWGRTPKFAVFLDKILI